MTTLESNRELTSTWQKLDNTLAQRRLVLETTDLVEADKALLGVFCNQWEQKKAS